MLSELERLAAMVADPVRVHEIGAEQWPLAMIASGLVTGNNPDKLPQNLQAYGIFVQKVTPAARGAALKQLVRFISGRKGEGWRALIPFAITEPETLISSAAAMQLATLAQPTDASKLFGVESLVQIFASQQTANPAAFSALLGLSDMRALPLLNKLNTLPTERWQGILAVLTPPANHLSYQWAMALLEAQPVLAADITALIARMAPTAECVVDLVLPIPTWAFEKPAPQPLHGWTRPEYFARMLPVLSKYLSSAQIDNLRRLFCD